MWRQSTQILCHHILLRKVGIQPTWMFGVDSTHASKEVTNAMPCKVQRAHSMYNMQCALSVCNVQCVQSMYKVQCTMCNLHNQYVMYNVCNQCAMCNVQCAMGKIGVQCAMCTGLQLKVVYHAMNLSGLWDSLHSTIQELHALDVTMNLVCGECKVLVTSMRTKYKTCSAYCSTIGRRCTGAWEGSVASAL